jgi:hypothetical protein
MSKISANIFSQVNRCAPAIGTSYDSCGSVTRCNVIGAHQTDLETIFMDSGDFRDMTSLLIAQFEMKACGTRVNGLFDFLMASARNFSGFINKKKVRGSDSLVEPFILGQQKSIINDEYWTVLNGSGTADSYEFHIINRYGIDLDPAWFAPGARIFVFSKTDGGTATRTAWRVISAELSTYSGNDTVLVTAASENAGSLTSAPKVTFPTSGFLVIGTNNVSDWERFCHNQPALNPNRYVPFWFQTSRWTMCTDSLYEEALARLISVNEYFRQFGDVSIAERNRQYGMLFQRSWLQNVFWNKPISANQTLNAWKNLDKIYTYGGSPLYLPNEDRCVGFRANAIGIYEQLFQCGQVYDLQGQQLNLIELFDRIYDIHRSRSSQGKVADSIDIYTDTTTAFLFHRAMIRYYNTQYEGLARFNISVSEGEHGVLGFRWSSYYLLFPKGVTINIITHFFFDDMGSAAEAEDMTETARFLWILDLGGGIYPGIIASNRKVFTTGRLEDLAKIDSAFACVMENPTQEVSLNSVTWTVVVECPPDNAIFENFRDVIPDHTDRSGDYADVYTYID